MKVVEIDWEDSCSQYGWADKKRVDKPTMTCKSVGILIHEDKETVTVSHSVNPNHCSSPMTIPRRAINKIKTIKTIKGK
jgi:hypothetical protein